VGCAAGGFADAVPDAYSAVVAASGVASSDASAAHSFFCASDMCQRCC
jgi:hypothetical protein